MTLDLASVEALLAELRRSGIGRRWNASADERASAAHLAVAEALARPEAPIERKLLFRRYRELLRPSPRELGRTNDTLALHELSAAQAPRSSLPSPEELSTLRERFEHLATDFASVDDVLARLASTPASLVAEALQIDPASLSSALAGRRVTGALQRSRRRRSLLRPKTAEVPSPY